MTLSDLEHFRNLLIERQENVTQWINTAASPDPENGRKAQALLQEIKEALNRVSTQSYGECTVCHGEVEHHRLEIQPTVEICLDCISREEKTQLEEELFLASKMHRALLPQTIADVPGFEVAAKSLAARMVGGDYYDFLPASGGDSRIVIADAMGKGIPAGLLMSNLQGALRIMAEEDVSPRALVARLNSWLCRNVPVTKFVSLALAALESGTDRVSRVTIANAGHCAPILLRYDGTIEMVQSTGGVLGIHSDFTFGEQELKLYPGDLLLFYTDGVTEAEDTQGEMFGEERLLQYLCEGRGKSLQELLDGLLTRVQTFSSRSEPEDDYTVIALRKML